MTQVVENLEKYFLLGSLLLLITLLFFFCAPFLGTIFIAVVNATAIFPLKKYLEKKFHLSSTLLTFCLLSFVILLILIPLGFFFMSLVEQATGVYLSISNQVNTLVTAENGQQVFLEKIPWIAPYIERLGLTFNPEELLRMGGNIAGGVSTFLLAKTTFVLKNLTLLILHLIVFVMAMFYFIRDGEKIVHYIRSLLPLSEKHRLRLFGKIHDLMHSIIFGVFGAALVQGILVGLGFALVGIENAIFWAAVAAILSPIPYVGTSVVWIPAVIYFFVQDMMGPGVFLLIWGLVVVATSDNIVKPFLIGSTASLHPLAVLLIMLGGAFTFGFMGLIFGPFILTLTLAFLDIYQLEYAKVLLAEEKEEEPKKKVPWILRRWFK